MTAKTWVTSENKYAFGYKIIFIAKSRILSFTIVLKNVLTAWGFVYTLLELKMLGLAIGEVLGLRWPYNGVRLRFMVHRCIFQNNIFKFFSLNISIFQIRLTVSLLNINNQFESNNSISYLVNFYYIWIIVDVESAKYIYVKTR